MGAYDDILGSEAKKPGGTYDDILAATDDERLPTTGLMAPAASARFAEIAGFMAEANQRHADSAALPTPMAAPSYLGPGDLGSIVSGAANTAGIAAIQDPFMAEANRLQTASAASKEVLKKKGFTAASRNFLGKQEQIGRDRDADINRIQQQNAAEAEQKAITAKINRDNAPRNEDGSIDRTWGDAGKDAAMAVSQAISGLMAGGSYLAGKAGFDTADTTAKWLDIGRQADAEKSVKAKDANQKVSDAKGLISTARALYDNPIAILDQALQSAPIIIPGVGIGSAASTVLAKQALKRALAAGATREAAMAAATAASVTGAVVGGRTGESLASAGMGGAQAEEGVLKTDFEELRKNSARFRDLSARVGDHAARVQLADEVGVTSAWLQGGATAVGGYFAGKLNKVAKFGDSYSAALVGRIESANKAARNMAGEVTEEVFQGPTEQLAQNIAGQRADNDLSLGKDVAKSGVLGAVGALGQSGAAQGIGLARSTMQGGLMRPTAAPSFSDLKANAERVAAAESLHSDLNASPDDIISGAHTSSPIPDAMQGGQKVADQALLERLNAIPDAGIVNRNMGQDSGLVVGPEGGIQSPAPFPEVNQIPVQQDVGTLADVPDVAGMINSGQSPAPVGGDIAWDNQRIPLSHEETAAKTESSPASRPIENNSSEQSRTFSPQDTPETVAAHRIEVAKQEINRDIADGKIPADVSNFSQLHDYVDGNEYVNDAERTDRLIGPIGKKLGWGMDEYIRFSSGLINSLDSWLANGRKDAPAAGTPASEGAAPAVKFDQTQPVTDIESTGRQNLLKRAGYIRGAIQATKDEAMKAGLKSELKAINAKVNGSVPPAAAPQKAEAPIAAANEQPALSDGVKRADDLGGPIDEKPMARANRVMSLAKQSRRDGVTKTAKQWVEDGIAAGDKPGFHEENKIKDMSRQAYNRANNRQQEDHAKRVAAGGKVKIYTHGDWIVSKAAYDYAMLLQSQKAAAESAPTPDQRADNNRRISSAAVATEQRQGQRRVDTMTAEEMRQALLVNPLTDMPNQRAFEEDADLGWENVGAMDVDGFGFLNDIWGHDPVDAILKQIGHEMSGFATDTVRLYHRSGDEFAARGKDKAELQSVLKAVQDHLKARTFEADLTLDGGEKVTAVKEGIGVTYGISTNYKSADDRANESKRQRLAAGDRSAKGSNPGGMAEVVAEGRKAGLGAPGLSKEETLKLSYQKTDPEQEAANRREELREASSKRMRSANAERNKVKPADELKTAIAKLGGLSREEAKSQGIDPADFTKRAGMLWIFPAKAGASFDQMAERLIELSYPVQDEQGRYSANKLLDLLDDSLRGNGVYTAAGNEAVAQADYIQRAFDENDEAALPPSEVDSFDRFESAIGEAINKAVRMGFDFDVLYSMGVDDSLAETNRMIAGLIDGDKEYGDRYDSAAAVLRGRDSNSQETSRSSQEEAQGFADLTEEDAERHIEESDFHEQIRADRQPDDFSLSAQSPEDLAAKDARENDKKAAREAERRREIENSRDSFTLGTTPGTATSAPRARNEQTDVEQAVIPSGGLPIRTRGDASSAIGDFGERLEGARKFLPPSMSESVSAEDIANLPLSKIWPADAHKSIENPYHAAFVYSARAEIPAKPRIGYKLARWVEKVKGFRQLVTTLETVTPERFEEKAREMGFSALQEDFLPKVRLLSQLPRDTWARVESAREWPNAMIFKDNESIPSPTSMVVIDGNRHQFFGDGRIGATELARIKDILDGEKPAASTETKKLFEVRAPRSGGFAFINRKGDGEYRHLKIFTGTDAVKQARAFIESSADELVAEWENVKARDNVKETDVRNTENRGREAKDWRGGKDAAEAGFSEAFGFRGVQFGEWVGQGRGGKERQGLLNEAFDALMDLADLLGIPSQAISLNGSLGLSFGARGSGKASAHFEPSNLVINLTKTKGAGALAHEWFHALDNYFARARGGEVTARGEDAYRQNNYITYKPERMLLSTKGFGEKTAAEVARMRELHQTAGAYKAENWIPSPNHKEGVRIEVEAVFARLVEALNASPMAQRAGLLDKKIDGYWSRIIERGARSFENYVISKMAQRGQINDFLANIKNWKQWNDSGKSNERYPYLFPAEEAPISEAFDELFQTIKVKEEDGKAMLYSRPGNAWYYSPLSRAVESIITPITEKWKNGPRVEVVQSASDLPGDAVPHDIEGAYSYAGVIYLVADNLPTEQRVMEVLAHESVGHAAMEEMLGPELMAELTKNIGAWEKMGSKVFVPLGKEVDKRQPGLSAERRAKEIVALMAERGMHKQGNVWARVVGAIRAFLRSRGLSGKWLDAMSEADVFAMLANAERYLEDGRQSGKRKAQAAPAYSRQGGRSADDLTPGVLKDDNGKPITLYHGGLEWSNAEFGKAGRDALWLTPEVSVASGYADQFSQKDGREIKAFHVTMENPLDLTRPEVVDQVFGEDDAPAPHEMARDRRLIEKALKYAKANGYDGLIHPDSDNLNRYSGDRVSYAVFSNDQLQLAPLTGDEQDSNTYDIPLRGKPNDPRAPDSVGAVRGSNENLAYSRPGNTIPEETSAQGKQRVVQDKFNRFKVLQDWAKSQGIDLSEAADVYQAETLMSGKTSTRKEDFRELQMKPLIKKTQSAGISMEQVGDFLKVQHAPEANRRARKIQGRDDATAFGVTDKEAADAMADFKAMPNFAKLKEIANEWRGVTDQTKKIRNESGLLSDEEMAAWDNTYEAYVPVKGRESAEGTGKGLNVAGKTKRRMGHELRDEAILENIWRDHERAISLDEKNRVGKSLIQFGLEINNDAIMTIGKPVKRKVLSAGQSHYMVTYHGSDIAAFDNMNDARRSLADQALKYGRDKADFSIEKTTDPVRVMLQASPMLADNEVNVYVGGHAVRIQINDEVAARAYTNLGVEHLNAILAAGREANNWLSKAYTGYSPDFIFTNPLRDALQGLATLTGEHGVVMAGKIFARYPHAVKELLKHFRNPGSSALVSDYRAEGGSTGAAYLSDLERINDDMQAAYDEYSRIVDVYNRTYAQAIADGKKVSTAVTLASLKSGISGIKKIPVIGHALRLMERINSVTENALRVATYDALVKNGMSKGKAAAQAKNLMNFNRKGEISNQAGALYLFFNPSIQGTQVIHRALFESPHKWQARALGGMMVLAAYGLAEMARSGGEDDEKKWKKTPNYIKDGNLVVGFGDYQATLTLPYGYRVFHMLGNVISDYRHGEDADKLGIRLASGVFANFSPIGNPMEGNLPGFQLLPTVPKMLLGPSVNEDGFGRELMPEKYSNAKPDSQNMYRATKGSLYATAAEAMNELRGGSKYNKGAVDVSPETLKYWVKSLTGGAGQFAIDSINTPMMAMQGVNPSPRDYPVVRRFVREVGITDSRSAFWERANEVKEAAESFAAAKKAGDYKAVDGILNEHEDIIFLAKYANTAQKMVSKRRDAIDEIRTDESLTLKQKHEQMKAIEEEENAIYSDFIDIFDESKK